MRVSVIGGSSVPPETAAVAARLRDPFAEPFRDRVRLWLVPTFAEATYAHTASREPDASKLFGDLLAAFVTPFEVPSACTVYD